MVGAVGILTIAAHGVCDYAYGVLLTPIDADTGWSLGQLADVLSAALVITGMMGIVAGRVSDRAGT